jgi:hypothetical protein
MMNARRRFLQLASAGAIPASATLLSERAQAENGRAKGVVGAWKTVVTLPFPPGSFREFLTFCEGGGLLETNSYLHTNSNLDYSAFQLPNVVNASDGQGNWERIGGGQVRAIFHKLLFDGARNNFGDLRVVSTLRIDGARLVGTSHVEIVDTEGNLLGDFGDVASEGERIG